MPFLAVGRIPLPGDNVAIATRTLAAGTRIAYGGAELALDHTVLEGHRFAVEAVRAGEQLFSWQLPFGVALRDIAPGDYIANAEMLEALHGRSVELDLPATPNFADLMEPYQLDLAAFEPAEQVERYAGDLTFQGYRRPDNRGVGTRNMIVLLGTSSRTAGFVRQLEQRLAHLQADYPNIDGIVAVAHTEGDHTEPNNRDFVLRTLAGFMVHPNVGAVLAVDYGAEPINNATLQAFMAANGYQLEQVPHHFLTISGGFLATLERAEAIVHTWLEPVNEIGRTTESAADLKIALQCGGSDAFSGVSGNPLASWVAKEIIGYGGSANLAETDELIGAEPYVLQKVSDAATAQRFLEIVESFKARVAWHGSSAAGNPSGGNKFRGLYNIALKSIGAARKRHPDVRLDYVIPYAERMQEPGFYFMDSPGNDLESIAGQVAAGCNLIFFTTGNGSITNFPFVPTIKIVTTSRRYDLLRHEMDVNAGRYLDGESMDAVGHDTLELAVAVASGQRTTGELAGHAQVQLWRNWRQRDASRLEALQLASPPDGRSLPIIATNAPRLTARLEMHRKKGAFCSGQVGLILPTSLCAGQVAQIAAQRLNARQLGQAQGIERFVALAHTEGCGVSGEAEKLYIRALLGYLQHPLAAHVLLMEHGCEKTHNDYIRHALEAINGDAARYGWASIQLDGGIEAVLAKTEAWFASQLAPTTPREAAGIGAIRLGLHASGPVSDAAARALAQLCTAVVHEGGTLVVAENAAVLSSASFCAETVGARTVLPTLAYGQALASARDRTGFHVMEAPTSHWTETVTGLAATGVEVVIGYTGSEPQTGHPLVPLVQVSAEASVLQRYAADMDLVLDGNEENWGQRMLDQVADVLSRRAAPKASQQGNIDFQFTRGLLGVSL
ncbi:MAG: UxaA family hydrolase [Caldilineaceae bacterium]|nr:UxaA family hydrolase [Caldilineaceae bacterium]